MSRLSVKQRACLGALRDSHIAGHAKGPVDLARAMETTPEGAAMTASSLVRRGLVLRSRAGGAVRYAITDDGLRELYPHAAVAR